MESILLNKNSGNNLSITEIAKKLMYFEQQFQLLHWNTTSYAEHNALGGIYEFINANKDIVIEVLMGYKKEKVKNIDVSLFANKNSLQLCDEFCMFVKQLKAFSETEKLGAISNKADEMSEIANKTKYLLTLL